MPATLLLASPDFQTFLWPCDLSTVMRELGGGGGVGGPLYCNPPYLADQLSLFKAAMIDF